MSTCRSCGAEVVWGTTLANKRVPLDVEQIEVILSPTPIEGSRRVTACPNVEGTETVTGYEHPDMYVLQPGQRRILARTNHFATCPNAKQHRTAA